MWGQLGCSYYGFLALFLGFCQMHVPVLMILDAYLIQSDPKYGANKDKNRKTLVLVSFLLSLFFGAVPLLAWTPMGFEPSGLSCSVYQEKANMGYISYIMSCFFVFEFIPLAIVAYCMSQQSQESKNANKRVIYILV